MKSPGSHKQCPRAFHLSSDQVYVRERNNKENGEERLERRRKRDSNPVLKHTTLNKEFSHVGLDNFYTPTPLLTFAVDGSKRKCK